MSDHRYGEPVNQVLLECNLLMRLLVWKTFLMIAILEAATRYRVSRTALQENPSLHPSFFDWIVLPRTHYQTSC